MFNFFRSRAFKIAAAVVSLLLLLLLILGNRAGTTSKGGSNLTSYLFTPAQKLFARVGDGWDSQCYLWADKERLEAEAAEWKAKYEHVKLANRQTEELLKENERLQQLLEFKEGHPEYNLQAARVIGRSHHSWYRTVTIDKGSEHGIKTDMPVIRPEGLVGVVAGVNTGSAEIFLITDREIAVGAILQENRDARGIIQGTGESSRLELKNVPYYSPIEAGDTVITSGLSQIYPKGIKIGTVSELNRQDSGLLYWAMVQPAVNFDTLEEVFVITSYVAVPELPPPPETN